MAIRILFLHLVLEKVLQIICKIQMDFLDSEELRKMFWFFDQIVINSEPRSDHDLQFCCKMIPDHIMP